MRKKLDKFFEITARGSNIQSEARGGVATFLTMAYILFANPAILSAGGIPFSAAVASTALAAGVCCLLMGIFGNFPIALASGMGLNSLVAFQLAHQMGSWQKAMGLVVLDGLVVFLLVVGGAREAIMKAIPRDLKFATSVGIGLFIAFIGLVQAKIVVVPGGTLAVLAKDPKAAMPPVTFGGLHTSEAWVAMFGLVFTSFLLVRRIRGAIIWGILVASAIGLYFGLSKLPSTWTWPDFSLAFQADIAGAFSLSYLPLLLSLIMVDFFDTLGTVTAIAEHAGLNQKGRIPRLQRILAIDGLSASIGGLLGASSVTTYIESAAGVAEGARTGFATVVTGILFLLCIFVAPLVGVVPTCATTPALILVGFLMTSQIRLIDFEDLATAIPAFIILLTIPLTFSISHGIGLGFLSYVIVKCLSGKPRDVHPLMYATALIFALHFAWGLA